MKKLISIVLCLLILFATVSCSADNGSQKGDGAGQSASTADADNNITKAPADELVELGTVDGRRYENTFVGIGTKLPEAWEYYSETQLKKLNNCAEDMPEDEYIAKVSKATAVIDMYAFHKNGTGTIEVTMEKIPEKDLSTFKLEDYYEKYKSAYETYYKDMGYKDIAFTTESISFSGHDATALKMTAKDTLDTDVYQIFVAGLKGNYCYCISLTSFEEDQTGIVSDFFYAIEE